MQIKEYMTQDHRKCDESFAKVEEAVLSKDYLEAENFFKNFKEHTLRHFKQEEELLFVEFTNATGMSGGPVEVMTYEHNQIRGLLEQLENAIQSKNSNDFLGLSESLMILLQQHNMKEEQILYNMIQMNLNAKNDELLAQLETIK